MRPAVRKYRSGKLFNFSERNRLPAKRLPCDRRGLYAGTDGKVSHRNPRRTCRMAFRFFCMRRFGLRFRSR